ncbi:MAG: T9SS type A sorting domain-containing protein [Bacteroidia bacterium]
MKLSHFLPIACLFAFSQAPSQTGPNSPTTATNNAGTGTNAWTSPGNILTSNNVRATVSATGNTNYLFATNFGFSIASPANIDGIAVEVEKRENTPADVAILNAWSTGLTTTVSAGTNRCLIVVIGLENGSVAPDVTALTYGGQAMTQIYESISNGGFVDKLEVWMLLETGIAAAVGTSLVPTYAAVVNTENCDFYTSIAFQNVDQTLPVSSAATSQINASTNPHQLGAPFNTLAGSMALTAVICGNNTTPTVSIGGTNTYTVNSSFVEGTDVYAANPSFSTSGFSMETATKVIAAPATEQPSFTFNGSVNRSACIGFTLQRARALDNIVRIMKTGTPVGTNLALTTTSWPTTEAYVTYGGPANLWGLSWTTAEVNAATFGVALSAQKRNGNLDVDHVRITVWSTSTLPIELLEFTAAPEGQDVITQWVTATETNNDYFLVERSINGSTFETAGRVDGAGNSTQLLSYQFKDEHPYTGTSYYRLKQVDYNGGFSYSQVVPVTFAPETISAVYPNPSCDGVFTFVQGSVAVNEVAIFSADLKLIKTVQLAAGEKPIVSIQDAADGIYFLIYEEAGVRQVKKVQKASGQN